MISLRSLPPVFRAASIFAASIALVSCAHTPPKSRPHAHDSALEAPRLIRLDGAQNFRDIGGYRTADGRRVKWGLIYRSADLSKLTGDDLTTLNSLNIGRVFDLRSSSERRSNPDRFAGRDATMSIDYEIDAREIVAALKSSPASESVSRALAAVYPRLLGTLQPEFRDLFASLLQDPGATLYHCTAGKDRTGIATALILSALGVPRDTIVADFLMSNRYYRPAVGAAPGSGMPPELRAVLTQVDERYLSAVFDAMDSQYGSVDGYLDRELGIDKAKLARLREFYTEN